VADVSRRSRRISETNPVTAEEGEAVGGKRSWLSWIRHLECRKMPSIPFEVRVYKGVLTMHEDGRQAYYKDVNAVERLLLLQARDHGYADLVSGVTEIENQ